MKNTGENVVIVKNSGEKVFFSEQKYKSSLRKSGASEEVINLALKNLLTFLHDGMTTQEIYRITHKFLSKNKKHSIAGRYNLKQAIMQLGPSGFPFEKYISELFKKQGYKTLVGQEVRGKCAKYEIDVIAKKDKTQILAECKFHGNKRNRCALQTLLYVKARHDDIQEYIKQKKPQNVENYICYLITNTKITSVGINYGKCRNIKMLAWSYPHNNGLEKIVDKMGLHPITCLSSLTKKIKLYLLKAGVILCSDIRENINLLKQVNLNQKKIDTILQECQEICEYFK